MERKFLKALLMMKELEEGIYIIPEDYHIEVLEHGRKISIIRNIHEFLKPGQYRCIHCKNRVRGYCIGDRYYIGLGWVCKAKEKILGKRAKKEVERKNFTKKLFKVVTDYKPACDKFEYNENYQRFTRGWEDRTIYDPE